MEKQHQQIQSTNANNLCTTIKHRKTEQCRYAEKQKASRKITVNTHANIFIRASCVCANAFWALAKPPTQTHHDVSRISKYASVEYTLLNTHIIAKNKTSPSRRHRRRLDICSSSHRKSRCSGENSSACCMHDDMNQLYERWILNSL